MATLAAHDHVLNVENINPNVKAMEYAVRYQNFLFYSFSQLTLKLDIVLNFFFF